MSPAISIERRDDGVAILSLNAPERRNALTVSMAGELTAACDELERVSQMWSMRRKALRDVP
jgi:enoyl-CoA hydratase/carnithine racemase